ncbi:unnamed protein product [Ostreobium quekettii]|uniref:Tyrosine-protein kinase catalytic domain-containing protein n=1 Tax=Ostreobium quekettii TaxID=121088 RepID=A0A8S1JDI6_9CHLO|nr:unnamed protein product [Ostreobium quekettii]
MAEIVEIVTACFELAVKIEECIRAARESSEAQERLATRIRTTKTVLREIEEQYGGATTNGLRQALECVQEQLERAAGIFDKERNEGRLRRLWEARGRCAELSELDKCLQGAVGVLLVAQTALLGAVLIQTHQKVDDVKRMLEKLTTDEKNWVEEPKQISDTFAEKLADSSSNEEQMQHRNEGPPRYGQRTSSGSLVPAASEEPVRYNQQMLQFLKQQMDTFNTIFTLPKFYSALKASPEGWGESMEKTMDAMKLGWMLIDRHKKQFKLDTFYKIYEAKTAVEKICSTLKEFLDAWEFHDVKIDKSVPQDAIKADKDELREYLAFVLRDGSCAFQGLPEHVKKEWELVKVSTSAMLGMVKVPATDEEIVLGRHISGAVYEGEWDGTPVAVKKMLKDNDPSKLDLEDFAQFFMEAVALAKLKSPHIVTFLAATESGRLVMELGKEQLLKWCEARQKDSLVGLAPEGLPLRLGLLLQAAKALKEKKAAGNKPCTLNPNLGAPAGLEEVMLKCTETDPGARYSSMKEVCNALEAVIKAAGWSV